MDSSSNPNGNNSDGKDKMDVDNGRLEPGQKGADGKYDDYDVGAARQFSRERGRHVTPGEMRTNAEGEYYVKGDSRDGSPEPQPESPPMFMGLPDSPQDASPEQESHPYKDESKPSSAPAEPNSKKRSKSEDDEDSNETNKRFKQDSSDVTSDTEMPSYGWDDGE